MSFVEGSIVTGAVTGIAPFGAFVQLADGITGLVHISEVADTYVRDVSEFLHVGDQVTVKVLARDKAGKIALSIKQASPDYQERALQRSAPRQAGQRGPRSSRGSGPRGAGSFEDKLNRFLKDSGERQSSLKKHNETKRGGRGA